MAASKFQSFVDKHIIINPESQVLASNVASRYIIFNKGSTDGKIKLYRFITEIEGVSKPAHIFIGIELKADVDTPEADEKQGSRKSSSNTDQDENTPVLQSSQMLTFEQQKELKMMDFEMQKELKMMDIKMQKDLKMMDFENEIKKAELQEKLKQHNEAYVGHT